MRPTWLAPFLIPFVVTPVVAGIAWRFFMWQQEFGVINHLLGALGGPDPYWLLERETALIAAYSVLVVSSVVVFALAANRYIVSGMTAGAVKG